MKGAVPGGGFRSEHGGETGRNCRLGMRPQQCRLLRAKAGQLGCSGGVRLGRSEACEV